LHGRVVFGFGEHVVEGRGGNDTAHDTSGGVNHRAVCSRRLETLTLGHIRKAGTPLSQPPRGLARGAGP
jgi:hypothetical protein